MANLKIGVGIITCERTDFLKRLLTSLNDCDVDTQVIVNDSETKLDIDTKIHIIDNQENLGVGKSKNRALQYLLDQGAEHLFLLEDDIYIKQKDVFQQYIHTSECTGVKHLNFCLHGEDNKKLGEPAPKIIVDYGDVKLALYNNVYGALTYYHKDVLDEIGLMDEEYFNAMEHVDHTMQVIKAGFHPPFRWFADIPDSNTLLDEQDNNHDESKIRKDVEWLERFRFGVERFHAKFDINVCSSNQPVSTKQEALQSLKDIKKTHG